MAEAKKKKTGGKLEDKKGNNFPMTCGVWSTGIC